MKQSENIGRVGSYRLEKCLGSGGEGVVFLGLPCDSADSRGCGEPVAVKVALLVPNSDHSVVHQMGRAPTCIYCAKGLHYLTGGHSYRTIAGSDAAVVLWNQYARLSALGGSLLPRALEFGCTPDVAWYAMELLEGRNLRRTFQTASPASARETVALLGLLLGQMLDEKKAKPRFWHGDLKPENIIVDGASRVRLVDPGVEPCDHGGVGRTMTVQYNPLGLSRELADTSALAVMVAELLIGHNPFHSVTMPLVAGCCSGLRMGMAASDELRAIEKHLSLSQLRDELPRRDRELILSWLTEPRTYEQMFSEWRELACTDERHSSR